MIDLSQIKDHFMMVLDLRKVDHEVVGSDGGHVGRVDHIAGGEIELAKLDLGSGFKHHLIPLSWVEYIDDKKVHLSVTEDDAKSKWREKH